jgi:hypothetical protein
MDMKQNVVSARRLAETMLEAAEFFDGQEGVYERVQANAIAWTKRQDGMWADGSLTWRGIDGVRGYLERTMEMWDVAPC